MGKEIKLLLDERMSAGSYSVDFDGSSLASGIYFYSIQSGRYSAVKKMLLLK
jgi:hypothetical protein